MKMKMQGGCDEKIILYDTDKYLADTNKQWAETIKSQYIKDFGKEPTKEQINDIMEQKREIDCDNVLNKITNGNFLIQEQLNDSVFKEVYLSKSNSLIFKDELEYLVAEKCPNGYERIQIGISENQNLFVTIKNMNEKPKNIEVKTLTKDGQKESSYSSKPRLWDNPKFSQKIKIDGIKYNNKYNKSKQKSKSNDFGMNIWILRLLQRLSMTGFEDFLDSTLLNPTTTAWDS